MPAPPLNGLTAGSHSISCSYAGDAAYVGSTSGALTQTITKATPVLTLSSSPNPSSFGQSVSITATLQVTATGTIQFLDSSTVLGTVNVVNGIAVLTTTTLAVGTHTLSASYSGDGNYQSGGSAPTQQKVNKAATDTTIASSQNPAPRHTAVVFTATVSPATTGQALFFDGSTLLGTANLSAGSASLSVSTLDAGTHSITAAYLGNGNFSASASAALTETITKK